MRVDGRKPPAGPAARRFTVLSPLIPVVIPLASYFQRLAFEQATAVSTWSWRRGWWNRPVVFTLVVWVAFLLLAFVLFGVGRALGHDVV